MKCWASCLGNCNGQSGEHYFSAGLWGEKVRVVGMPWLKEGEDKILSRKTLVANVLCGHHNSLLSELDTAAINIWKKMRELEQIYEVRRRFHKVRYWHPLTADVDGSKFERWAVKSAIGLFCALSKNSFWSISKTPAIQVPSQIVRAVYGHNVMEKPFGLYLDQQTGDEIGWQDMTGFQAIHHVDGGFSGANLEFRGCRLLIWLDEQPNEYLSNLIYRPDSFRFTKGGRYSHKLKFGWNNLKNN